MNENKDLQSNGYRPFIISTIVDRYSASIFSLMAIGLL